MACDDSVLGILVSAELEVSLSTSERRLVERRLNLCDDRGLIAWAEVILAADGPLASDTDVVEMASLMSNDPRQVERAPELLMRCLPRLDPAFDTRASAAEAHAKRALGRRCRQLPRGEITPDQLCRVVYQIEHFSDYPAWLGELFDACDGCEPGERRAGRQELLDDAEVLARELER